MKSERCRLHGGRSTGPPLGQNVYRQGQYGASAIQNRRELRDLLRQFKVSLVFLGPDKP